MWASVNGENKPLKLEKINKLGETRSVSKISVIRKSQQFTLA